MNNTERAIGCHLSLSDGYLGMCRTAVSIGANTFQFFTKNPRGRSSGNFPSEKELAEMSAYMKENSLFPPLAHAPYTYNPCSADEKIREYTQSAMKEEVEFLENIEGALYNFHPGCHVGQGSDVGIAYTSSMLNNIIRPEMKTKVLIETMAGKGSEIGRTFEEVRMIIDGVDEDKRKNVGVCLDTCHIHDGGYEIASDPKRVFEEFDRVIGIGKLCAIHLNDSKNERGAAKDRHERLTYGYIPLDAMIEFISIPALEKIPVYLETPNELDGYRDEIALLRSRLG